MSAKFQLVGRGGGVLFLEPNVSSFRAHLYLLAELSIRAITFSALKLMGPCYYG